VDTSLGGTSSNPSGGSGTIFGSSGGSSSSGSGGASAGTQNASGGSGTLGSGGTTTTVPENASVVLYHQSDVIDATTNRIFMHFFIENKASDPLPMAAVSVRYWMTSEVAQPMLRSFYQGANIAGESLRFVDAGPNSYVEIRFTGNSISRGADLNASEFQLQIEGGTYNQSNDYSFEPKDQQRQPNAKITLYLAERLIWGCEPSGACPGDPVGAGGAGGAGGGSNGGADDGGAPAGGTASGGSANGGAPAGGSANGGSANGGAPAGGSANGGAPAGGSANGGSASGGAESGGTGAGGSSSQGGVATGSGGAPGGSANLNQARARR